jgi:undecaprenyl-diphosphatase
MSFEGTLIHSLQTLLDSRPGIFLSILCARWLIFVEVAWIIVLGFTERRTSLRHAAKEAGLAMLMALYAALTLSQLIGRLRPFVAEVGVLRLVPAPLSLHSLPSAHASAAFALAFAIAWKSPRAAIVPLILACGVAFGRVAVGVHYPTDVIAGAGVGLLAVVIVRLLHAAVRRTAVYREHTHG